jgi:hypothetical protein
MVGPIEFIVWIQGRLQYYHVHTKFHPNPPNGSKVIKVFLYTHLRSLNVRHFGMAEATRLKKINRGHLEWQCLSIKFHENPLIGSKVISRGQTDRQTDTHTHTHTHTHRDRQTGDLISPLSFFESRPKIYSILYIAWKQMI